MTQQSKNLHKNIAKYGCKYLCHLKIAELETGRTMTLEQLHTMYYRHTEKGWIQNKCDVIKPSEITTDFIKNLGGLSSVCQLGSAVNGTIVFWGKEQTAPIKYALRCYKTAVDKHWILCDKDFIERYDPYTKDYDRKYIIRYNLMG